VSGNSLVMRPGRRAGSADRPHLHIEAERGPHALLTGAEQVLLGRPLQHTTVDLGPGAPAWLPPVAPRAYASTVQVTTPGQVTA
jgi:hypothetical protein